MIRLGITAEQLEKTVQSRDDIVHLLLEIAAQEKTLQGGKPLTVLVQFPPKEGGVLLDIKRARWWDKLRFWRG